MASSATAPRSFLQPRVARRRSSAASSQPGALLSDSTSADEGDVLLSPVEETQPFYFGDPGVKLEPYAMRHDPTVRWAYRPVTLVGAAMGASAVAVLAYNSERVLSRQIREHMGVISGVAVFLIFCMLNFRDTSFRRPHPAFWRITLGLNLLYTMLLTFLLFQDKAYAREFMRYFDSSLGVELPERSYADDCSFSPRNIWENVDIFCLAHALGWFGKAVILRDHWFCWILSIGFEFMEYSLEHQLANFAECWWDHWILDVLLCNWFGLWLGMKTCQWLRVSPFSWRGLREPRGGAGGRARKAARNLVPYDWTEFRWEGTKTFRNYVSTVALLAAFLLSEVNVFYLKSLLWIAPEHPLVTIRLAAIFLWALPAVREFYEYVSFGKRVKRMGSHAWLLLLTILLELLNIVKWSTGEFPEPAPTHVKVLWSVVIALLVAYPVWKFAIPAWQKTQSGGNGKSRKPVEEHDGGTSANGVVAEEKEL